MQQILEELPVLIDVGVYRLYYGDKKVPVDRGGIGNVPFSVAEHFPLSPQTVEQHLDSFSSKWNGALIGFIGNTCAHPTRTSEKGCWRERGCYEVEAKQTKTNYRTAEWRPKTVKVTS